MLIISADEAEDESDVATHLIVWQLVRYAPREYRDAHRPALRLLYNRFAILGKEFISIYHTKINNTSSITY